MIIVEVNREKPDLGFMPTPTGSPDPCAPPSLQETMTLQPKRLPGENGEPISILGRNDNDFEPILTARQKLQALQMPLYQPADFAPKEKAEGNE